MKSTVLVLLALVAAQEGHISGEAYWLAERQGRLQSAEVRDGIVYVSIFEHHGPVRGWLTLAERDDPAAKEQGTIGAVQNLMVFIRSTLGSERAHGVDGLKALTGLPLEEPHEWLRWYDENGDFLAWHEATGRLSIDEARKRRQTPRARDGLRVRLSTDKRELFPGEPLWLTLGLENASRGTASVRGDFRLGEEWSVDLRRHRPDDVSYHHFRSLTLGGADLVELARGGSVERSYDHAAALESPLPPGPYSIRASFLGAESVTRFFDVLDEGGRRVQLFGTGLSFSGGDVDWQAVQTLLEGSLSRLEPCFDQAGAGSPIPGRITLEWTLERNGAAGEVSAKGGSLENSVLTACLTRALSELPFPAPSAGRPRLSYGLTFVP